MRNSKFSLHFPRRMVHGILKDLKFLCSFRKSPLNTSTKELRRNVMQGRGKGKLMCRIFATYCRRAFRELFKKIICAFNGVIPKSELVLFTTELGPFNRVGFRVNYKDFFSRVLNYTPVPYINNKLFFILRQGIRPVVHSALADAQADSCSFLVPSKDC